MTFAELRSKVRAVLQDSNGDYWSDDELDLYLNEAQEEFCRHTRLLRGEHPITTRENQAVYTLPEDCLEVLRVVGKNGAEVEPSHSRSLHGYRLDTTGTGDPTYHYSDLDGDGKMRFYPQPSPTIETGPTRFTGVSFHSVLAADLPITFVGDPQECISMNGLFYIVDTQSVYVLNKDLELLRTIAHGFPGPESITMSVVPSSVIENPYVTDNLFADEIIVASNQTIKVIATDDSLRTLTSSATGAIWKLFPVPKVYVNAIMWQKSNGDIFYGRLDNGSGSWQEFTEAYSLASVGVWPWWKVATAVDDDTIYFAGDFGIKGRQSDKSSDFANLVDLTDEAVYAMTETIGGYYVIRDTGVVSLWDGSSTFTDTGVTSKTGVLTNLGNTYEAWIHSNGGVTWTYGYDSGFPAVFEIQNGSIVATIRLKNGTVINGNSAMVGDRLYMCAKYAGDSVYRFYYLDSASGDLGAVTYIDGATVNQEEGAVVDIGSDADDLIAFSSELGAMIGAVSAEKVATVYYVRKPAAGLVEISDPLALAWYAIARAYEQDGEQSHLARSQYYQRKFREIMARTKRRVSGGFNSNTSPRKGRFY